MKDFITIHEEVMTKGKVFAEKQTDQILLTVQCPILLSKFMITYTGKMPRLMKAWALYNMSSLSNSEMK
jgi:hypothetical protein